MPDDRTEPTANFLKTARTEIAERSANQAGLQRAWGEEREKVARLEAEIEQLRSENLRLHGKIAAGEFEHITNDARAQAFEEAEQIALEYRDEADAGEHPDARDPDHSLGQGYAANRIAKRIGALAAKPQGHE